LNSYGAEFEVVANGGDEGAAVTYAYTFSEGAFPYSPFGREGAGGKLFSLCREQHPPLLVLTFHNCFSLYIQTSNDCCADNEADPAICTKEEIKPSK
jgi:hypothetical protein